MKKYRILYWFGSMRTEYIIRAINKEEAKKKFSEIKGDMHILDIEEISL